jgi:magnesium chelatase family protein
LPAGTEQIGVSRFTYLQGGSIVVKQLPVQVIRHTSAQECTYRKTCCCYPHGCPCGYQSDPTRECTCSAGNIARYQKRISGPLLDRIDIHIEVPRVEYEKLTDRRAGERSADVRARVQAARQRQAQRFAGTQITCNADMGPAEVRVHCAVEAGAQPLLRAVMQRLQLSARAFHRVLKLARTIADLADAEVIGAPHLAEAIQYRPRVGSET